MIASAEEVRAIPAIQKLYKADGTLDVQAYDSLLASVGITRDQLYAQTRNQIMMQEMTQTIPQSVVLPKGSVRSPVGTVEPAASGRPAQFPGC